MRRQHKRTVACILVAPMLITGCATRVSSRIPVDASDVCEQYRQPLRQADEEQGQLLARWVAGGALAGLIAGGSCALAKAKPQLCAPLGAAVFLGAVVVGYMHEKSNAAKNREDLLRSIDADSGAFGQELGELGQAAHNLTQCRQQQIAAVSQRYKAKAIDAQSGRAELAQIEAKIGEDQQLTSAFLGQMDQRTDLQLKARAAAEGLKPEQYEAQIPKGYTEATDVAVKPAEPPAPVRPQPLPKTVPLTPATYYTLTRSNLRLKPTAASGVANVVEKGTALTVQGKAGGWYAATHNSQPVFVAASLVSPTPPQIAYRNMRGNDETQKTYNMGKTVRQQAETDSADTIRSLEQAKVLLG